MVELVTTCFIKLGTGSLFIMHSPIKNHTVKEIEACLGAALSNLFGEQTYVLVEQVEMSGALKQGARLVIQAHKERRTPLAVVHIDKV